MKHGYRGTEAEWAMEGILGEGLHSAHTVRNQALRKSCGATNCTTKVIDMTKVK